MEQVINNASTTTSKSDVTLLNVLMQNEPTHEEQITVTNQHLLDLINEYETAIYAAYPAPSFKNTISSILYEVRTKASIPEDPTQFKKHLAAFKASFEKAIQNISEYLSRETLDSEEFIALNIFHHRNLILSAKPRKAKRLQNGKEINFEMPMAPNTRASYDRGDFLAEKPRSRSTSFHTEPAKSENFDNISASIKNALSPSDSFVEGSSTTTLNFNNLPPNALLRVNAHQENNEKLIIDHVLSRSASYVPVYMNKTQWQTTVENHIYAMIEANIRNRYELYKKSLSENIALDCNLAECVAIKDAIDNKTYNSVIDVHFTQVSLLSNLKYLKGYDDPQLQQEQIQCIAKVLENINRKPFSITIENTNIEFNINTHFFNAAVNVGRYFSIDNDDLQEDFFNNFNKRIDKKIMDYRDKVHEIMLEVRNTPLTNEEQRTAEAKYLEDKIDTLLLCQKTINKLREVKLIGFARSKSKKCNYLLHALVTEVCSHYLGDIVSVNCNDGEDRTGLLMLFIKSLNLYLRNHLEKAGDLSQLSDNFLDKLHELVQRQQYHDAALLTTQENSAAFGFEIRRHGITIDPSYVELASLSKIPYKKAFKLLHNYDEEKLHKYKAKLSPKKTLGENAVLWLKQAACFFIAIFAMIFSSFFNDISQATVKPSLNMLSAFSQEKPNSNSPTREKSQRDLTSDSSTGDTSKLSENALNNDGRVSTKIMDPLPRNDSTDPSLPLSDSSPAAAINSSSPVKPNSSSNSSRGRSPDETDPNAYLASEETDGREKHYHVTPMSVPSHGPGSWKKQPISNLSNNQAAFISSSTATQQTQSFAALFTEERYDDETRYYHN